jgi:hypothetical protein
MKFALTLLLSFCFCMSHAQNGPTTTKKITPPDTHLELFPNPTHDLVKMKLHLEKSQVFSVAIFNLRGKKVFDIAPRSYASGNIALSFSVKSLRAGTYNVVVISKAGKLMAEEQLIKN